MTDTFERSFATPESILAELNEIAEGAADPDDLIILPAALEGRREDIEDELRSLMAFPGKPADGPFSIVSWCSGCEQAFTEKRCPRCLRQSSIVALVGAEGVLLITSTTNYEMIKQWKERP